MTVFGDYHALDVVSRKNAFAIKELADRLPCHGKIDFVRLDPAATARSSLGPAAYSEYEQVFGSRLVARWPRHLVLDGLDMIDLLLESGNLLIHPRCLRLKDAFQTYSRQRRGGEWIDYPADSHPEEDLIDALRGGIRDAFPDGLAPRPNFQASACFEGAGVSPHPRLGSRPQLLDLDVLEPDFHRLRPDVDLQCDDSLLVELRIVAVDDPRAVQVDRHVRALGGDHELVPAVVLEQGLGFFERVALEDAAAPLLVEQAPLAIGHVGLGPRDHAIRLALAAELDARVAVADLDLGLEHEIAVGLFGRQELVLLEPLSLVRPTISPFSTVKSDLSSGVTQPVRSLPLKSGWNPRRLCAWTLSRVARPQQADSPRETEQQRLARR